MKRLCLLGPAVLFLSLASGATACSSWEDDNAEYQECLRSQSSSIVAERTPKSTGPLVEVDEASSIGVVREKVKADMRSSLIVPRATSLARARCADKDPGPKSKGLFGGGSSDTLMAVASEGSSNNGGNGGAGGASQVSTTNNQVAGVDEADFVKNDTKYIYAVSGSQLRIIEAWPAATAHEIAKVKVPGKAVKLFVTENRAVVYSSGVDSPPSESTNTANPYARPSTCTYQYGCSIGGDGKPTTISIFDITDKKAPKLTRTIKTSSSLLSSRRVGNVVHTVLTQWAYSVGNTGNGVTGAPYWATPYPSTKASEEAINRAFDDAEAKHDATIDAAPLDKLTPTFDDDAHQSMKRRLYRSNGVGGGAYTTLVSLDLNATQDVGVVSILSNPGAVYGSAEAIYLAAAATPSYYSYLSNANEDTTIHKFAVGETPSATTYRGSGIIDGHVLSQLSMDEKDGKLRIATSTGHPPDPDAHSQITILEDQGQQALATIGKIDNIAKGEDIRSVRFDGDRGYIVTFKKTDPLFSFDLSNPRAPRMLGELKIPGFSTYMHMMDANHLLTIGYDGSDQGEFAYFTGVLLQIFDVTNPSEPKLTHKEVIGTRGSSSEALTNHLAFTYFAPKNLLALPMKICEGGDGNGGFGDNMTFSGLMVFDTTVANGFSLRGKVSHPQAASGDSSPYNSACMSWWTNASSEVKRSIIMDDYVFSVSETRIKVNALGALNQDVKELSLVDYSNASPNVIGK